uniref:Uncharacterized protein n=1 Tax=Rhizophora mucronata TaxID=61149 RepID=A0A2P2INL9_RHIMU
MHINCLIIRLTVQFLNQTINMFIYMWQHAHQLKIHNKLTKLWYPLNPG